jgi:hypothetical protein
VYRSNNDDEEIGFADAYKSQILNRDDNDNDILVKNLIIILTLIAIILGLSIFGYIYISQTNIQSDTIEEIEEEGKIIEPPKSQMLNNIDELMLEESGNVDKVIETNETEKITKKETYLEQLADLSHEIDSGNKKGN